ncbi:hypothetical protein [Marinospirillum sp.]|uniref:hypothetical protein n=1 Tax=Marinospirillum sp. TaxID=2183934 RepID=UPI0028700D0A|nr:hypothetical protein [Marinospirillum sp.]MDR9468023.1 hypothetical protein [Marinospirillum sp.]
MGEVQMYGNSMWAGHWLWMLVFALIAVIPAWRICKRAGYPGWLGLLIVVPLLNLGLLYFLAFAKWPAKKNGGPYG